MNKVDLLILAKIQTCLSFNLSIEPGSFVQTIIFMLITNKNTWAFEFHEQNLLFKYLKFFEYQ